MPGTPRRDLRSLVEPDHYSAHPAPKHAQTSWRKPEVIAHRASREVRVSSGPFVSTRRLTGAGLSGKPSWEARGVCRLYPWATSDVNTEPFGEKTSGAIAC